MMKKKPIALTALIFTLLVGGGVWILSNSGVDRSETDGGPRVFSNSDITVELDKLTFKQNEDILLHLQPYKGFVSVLRDRNAMNIGTYASEGVQRLRTYSYGPGKAFIEIWKTNDAGEINFYTQSESGELTKKEPILEIPIEITK